MILCVYMYSRRAEKSNVPPYLQSLLPELEQSGLVLGTEFLLSHVLPHHSGCELWWGEEGGGIIKKGTHSHKKVLE